MIDCYDEVAPNFKNVDPPPRRGRPLRDGARVRPHRREHLPRRALAGAALHHAARPPATPTTAPPSRASTTAARRPTPAAGVCGIPGWQAVRAALARQEVGGGRGGQAAHPVAASGHRPGRPGHAGGPPDRRGGRQRRDPEASATAWCPRSPGARRRPRSSWSTPATTRSSAGPASTRSTTSTVRSTWCSWAWATAPSRSRWRRAARGATAPPSSSAVSSSPHDPSSTAIRDRVAAMASQPAWPCAAAAAWGS